MTAQLDTKIRLTELPARRDLELSAAFIDPTIVKLPLRQALEQSSMESQAKAALELYQQDENVFVRGTVVGSLDVACSRCLQSALVDIDVEVFCTFMPRGALPAGAESTDPDDDYEPSEDDEDLYGYEGEEVDVEPLLREQLILSVPFAPLCRVDCKGLCSQCGVDLNKDSCDCGAVVDPRLSVLQQMKVDS